MLQQDTPADDSNDCSRLELSCFEGCASDAEAEREEPQTQQRGAEAEAERTGQEAEGGEGEGEGARKEAEAEEEDAAGSPPPASPDCICDALDLTGLEGAPAHTSTPKAPPAPRRRPGATHSARGFTRGRRPTLRHSGRPRQRSALPRPIGPRREGGGSLRDARCPNRARLRRVRLAFPLGEWRSAAPARPPSPSEEFAGERACGATDHVAVQRFARALRVVAQKRSANQKTHKASARSAPASVAASSRERSPDRSWLRAGAEAGAPVRRWLEELAAATEPECTTALQSKSLAADLGRQVAAAAAAATSSVRALQERSRRIAAEFNKLCRQLELGAMEHVGPLVQSLTGHVAEFARQQANGGRALEALESARVVSGSGKGQHKGEDAGQEQGGFEQTRPDPVVVSVVEAPASEMALRAALAALAALGLEGRHLSALVAEAGGVRALLAVVLESRCSSVRAAAMRALAAVACAPDAIRCLESAGGVEVLAELLADDARPEPELAEAAAVLAQATAPWVEDNPGVRGLAQHLPSLVRSLSGLAERTSCAETLLLSAAALANVTHMEPRAVWELLAAGSAGRLLRAVRRLGAAASVFLQEQAAALLAAMAAVPESRARLAHERAVVALLCFLQVRASPLQDQPEIAAAERLQHKSAIALSRLCSDPAVAEQVVVLQGVTRLVRLCRDERERNHSDGVLVACLAALRKIAANCGTQVIEDLDALELVEPRLLDSFLLYSSRQESYV
ncbi:Inscuteable protein [Gryllus bimaculatus]|nr:Inscuteable protein [Gryllus bimaculatus]